MNWTIYQAYYIYILKQIDRRTNEVVCGAAANGATTWSGNLENICQTRSIKHQTSNIETVTAEVASGVTILPTADSTSSQNVFVVSFYSLIYLYKHFKSLEIKTNYIFYFIIFFF